MNRILVFFLFLSPMLVTCQKDLPKEKIRGSITNERAWWDLIHYDLRVTVDPESQSIYGENIILYKVLQANNAMQIDLQKPMKLDRIIQDGKDLQYTSVGNAHYITIERDQEVGKEYELTLFFSGKPKVAVHPPWNGGFTWEKDSNGNYFIANSNEGIGASVWWPNKDHPYDEPDKGVDITVRTVKNLVAVSNGRLIDVEENEDSKTWHWRVVNPINNYGVNINIGDYVHFSEQYKGEKGLLEMDYYVLRENEDKAKEQFRQAKLMMKAFEYWFGPYPFYEDGYKLVEVPYLGMEHQSSVTYGNHYENGYLGKDLSGTGWGLKFDFIIIHESGHEWFANNITNKDVADMWIHEGFAAYSENLYLDYYYGKEASSDYVIGTRKKITNKRPVIGEYGVNQNGGIDMYYKGANMLHTLRQLLEDDEKWRMVLRDINRKFYHQTVSSKDLETYISEITGIDLTEFFDQYLRTTMIPKLEIQVSGNDYQYRYTNIVDHFDMPVIVLINQQPSWIYPSREWKEAMISHPIESLNVKRDFYIDKEIIFKNQ